MGGWLEKWGLKLISTQVVVEVEVGVEFDYFVPSNSDVPKNIYLNPIVVRVQDPGINLT